MSGICPSFLLLFGAFFEDNIRNSGKIPLLERKNMAKKPAKAAPETGEAAPAKSKKKLIIIIAAAVLVLGGVGGGAAFFLSKKSASKEKEHKARTSEGAGISSFRCLHSETCNQIAAISIYKSR
jgi:hypothetical protein